MQLIVLPLKDTHKVVNLLTVLRCQYWATVEEMKSFRAGDGILNNIFLFLC